MTVKFRSQWKWKARNADKVRAHKALASAIRRGEVRRGRCVVCGSFRVDGHHPSYDAPLSVIWLCRRHHQALHRDRLCLLPEVRG